MMCSSWEGERLRPSKNRSNTIKIYVVTVLYSSARALNHKCNLDIGQSSIRLVSPSLIPAAHCTLPSIRHLTATNVETKTCDLCAHVYGCQHQVRRVFVIVSVNGWAAPRIVCNHQEISVQHSLPCPLWDNEVWWTVFIPTKVLNFCGAINSVCICVLVAKVLSKHNTASM